MMCDSAPAYINTDADGVACDAAFNQALADGVACDAASTGDPITIDDATPSDIAFMELALEEARQAEREDEVPIGAVVVYEGRVIARAHNRRETDKDPKAHAEFLAMEEASRVLDAWRLTGCTVYVTLEPCIMCAGLMHQARISRCVYATADPKAGACGSLYHIHDDGRLNHSFEITTGVLAKESAQLLQNFFARRRAERKKAKREAVQAAQAAQAAEAATAEAGDGVAAQATQAAPAAPAASATQASALRSTSQ